MNNRVVWVDWIKANVILLVMVGHCWMAEPISIISSQQRSGGSKMIKKY